METLLQHVVSHRDKTLVQNPGKQCLSVSAHEGHVEVVKVLLEVSEKGDQSESSAHKMSGQEIILFGRAQGAGVVEELSVQGREDITKAACRHAELDHVSREIQQ